MKIHDVRDRKRKPLISWAIISISQLFWN